MVKYLYIFIFFTSFFAQAQQKYIIQGKVFDKKDDTSIPFVNVFLDGTTIGTQTNQEGIFILKNIPVGNYRIVASMVGYATSVYDIVISQNDITTQIALVEDIKALNEVKIVGNRDKIWEKQYKEFEKEFLGNDIDKDEIKILNREEIEFELNKETKTLSAVSNKPLIIENRKLGYKQSYILQNFEKKLNQLSFKGLGRYELLEAQNEKQQSLWEKNRLEAYQGSLKHFLKSLLNNKLKEEGFKAFFLNIDPTNSKSGPMYLDFKPQDIITLTSTADLFKISLTKPMLIVYENEQLPPQISQIKQLSEIVFSKEGNLLDPYSVGISGRMGQKRIANLLPLDFELFEEATTMKFPNLSQLPKKILALTEIPREVISIEGIQPYYLAGETIRLDVFLLQFRLKEFLPQNDSTDIPFLSVPIYVEFIDLASGKLLNRFILKSDEGKANLALPTLITLPTGNFQIRAYTNWMRNFSQDAFFKQNFTIFSQNYKNEIPDFPKKTIMDTLIIHVEGGHLVENLKSKIAIEAKDSFGDQIAIPFNLLNSKNDTLANSETDSSGIATVDFTPQSNENYRITTKNKTFPLPYSKPKGCILTVDNLSSKDRIRIFIQTNGISDDTLTLLLINKDQIVFWKCFLNNRQTFLFNVPKSNLNEKINCFLMNKDGKQLSERIIEVNSNEKNIDNLVRDKVLLTQPLSHFYSFDSKFKFSVEKGLTLKGNINRLGGKENRKEIKLAMVLSGIENDTLKQNVQTFFTETKNKFTFQNIEFFGKKKVTFIATDNIIALDTAFAIPLINVQKMPINWHFLQKTQDLANLEKRKNEIILEKIRKEKENILLNEVEIRAKKTDPNAINGISPNIVLDEKRIINQPTMSGLLYMLIPQRKNRFGTGLKVFIDTQELRQDEIDNIDLDINPSSVEKILVFEEVIPPLYGRATCAIVIVLRRGASRETLQTNQTFIVEGYYKE